MGHQSLVIINNDHIHTARNNPTLGELLYRAVAESVINSPVEFANGLGVAYRSTHADQISLLMCGNLQMEELTSTWFLHSMANDDRTHTRLKLQLLKQAAEKLGYRLHQIPASQRHG